MQSRGTAASRYLRIGGILAIVAAAQWIIGVFIAQAYYPSYSITQNDLSDLGATCHNATMPTPGSCVIFQPSSIIWNTVLSLLGILTMASAYMIYRGLGNRLFSTLVGLFGLGALIAGVVPENVDLTTHGLGALVSFVAGAIAAVTVYRAKLEAPPYFRYFSILFGIISLAGLAIMLSVSFATLESSIIGHGGDERVIVYPLLVWEIVVGISLIRTQARKVQHCAEHGYGVYVVL